MLKFFSNIFGSKNDRILKRMMSFVNTANKMEKELSEKPDSYFLELKDQLLEKYKENNDKVFHIGYLYIMMNKQLITIIIFCGIGFAVIRILLESFFPGGISL